MVRINEDALVLKEAWRVPKTTLFGTLPTLLQNLYLCSYFYSEPLYVVLGFGLGPEQSPLYKTGEGIFIRDLEWRFP